MSTPFYDIIGDVHGHASLLKKLLKKVGYKNRRGVWGHPSRQAVFVGDYINRGDEIRETLHIIRSMMDHGNAQAVLGNHEYSAILYDVRVSYKFHIKEHASFNTNQLKKTHEQFKSCSKEWESYLKWLRAIPLFLELDGIRISHAYWNDEDINIIKRNLPKGKLKKKYIYKLYNGEQYSVIRSIHRVLKGLEFNCPQDLVLRDSNGIIVKRFRMNWWESPDNKSFHELAFGNRFTLPKYTVPKELAPSFTPYKEDKPPLFVGHYCLPEPLMLQNNICCVDSCVGTTGSLSAYRWHGESKIVPEHFVSV